MSDPTANRTLELACKVGSLADAREAIEDDGADVNFQGGAPLFLAIVNRHRDVLELLLDHGAGYESYIAKKRLATIETRGDLVEELIAAAPHNPRDVEPERIAEIDEQIRTSGVEYLLSNLDWDNATRFRDSLDAIGAGSSHRCVAEFLHWARSESRERSGGLDELLTHYDDTVSEYRERYLSSGEDLVALAHEFVGDSDGDPASN